MCGQISYFQMQLGVPLALKPLQWPHHWHPFLTQTICLDPQYQELVLLQEPPLIIQSFYVGPPPN